MKKFYSYTIHLIQQVQKIAWKINVSIFSFIKIVRQAFSNSQKKNFFRLISQIFWNEFIIKLKSQRLL